VRRPAPSAFAPLAHAAVALDSTRKCAQVRAIGAWVRFARAVLARITVAIGVSRAMARRLNAVYVVLTDDLRDDKCGHAEGWQ
jgi:hypothetical protein